MRRPSLAAPSAWRAAASADRPRPRPLDPRRWTVRWPARVVEARAAPRSPAAADRRTDPPARRTRDRGRARRGRSRGRDSRGAGRWRRHRATAWSSRSRASPRGRSRPGRPTHRQAVSRSAPVLALSRTSGPAPRLGNQLCATLPLQECGLPDLHRFRHALTSRLSLNAAPPNVEGPGDHRIALIEGGETGGRFMRLQRAMPALAAAITLAGSAAPAYAFVPEIGPKPERADHARVTHQEHRLRRCSGRHRRGRRRRDGDRLDRSRGVHGTNCARDGQGQPRRDRPVLTCGGLGPATWGQRTMAWRTPPPELTAWLTPQRRPDAAEPGQTSRPARRRRLSARRRRVRVRRAA